MQKGRGIMGLWLVEDSQDFVGNRPIANAYQCGSSIIIHSQPVRTKFLCRMSFQAPDNRECIHPFRGVTSEDLLIISMPDTLSVSFPGFLLFAGYRKTWHVHLSGSLIKDGHHFQEPLARALYALLVPWTVGQFGELDPESEILRFLAQGENRYL